MEHHENLKQPEISPNFDPISGKSGSVHPSDRKEEAYLTVFLLFLVPPPHSQRPVGLTHTSEMHDGSPDKDYIFVFNVA